jgi:hypothetical protein
LNNLSEWTKNVDKIYKRERGDKENDIRGANGSGKLTWDNARSREIDRRGILEKEGMIHEGERESKLFKTGREKTERRYVGRRETEKLRQNKCEEN